MTAPTPPDAPGPEFGAFAERLSPKRALVRWIRAAMPTRFRWVNTRILHLMAFRPGYFAAAATRSVYGPLYTRCRIPKGRGRHRVIDIPNRPLYWVQKRLLQLVLDAAQTGLPPAVTGCRPGGSAYLNARAHLGQRFVLNADLTDFFPSIGVGDIAPALLRLGSFAVPRAALMEGARPKLAEARSGSATEHAMAYEWDAETAVLVSRLVTRFGRLPQGAPTSPAAANLVFAPFDRRIVAAVGPQVVYTRYVDDLTFSVSPSACQSLGLRSPGAFREYVLSRLDRVFRASAFRTNPSKTRCTGPDRGHEVTGLRVGPAGASGLPVIDLPRDARRYVRALAHQLAKFPLAEVARIRVGGDVHAQIATPAKDVPAGGGRHRGRRRASAERLTADMARVLLRDLAAEQIDPVGESRPVVGREVWELVERVLSYLWRGQAIAAFAGEGRTEVVIRGADESEVCRLRASDPLDLFVFARRDAVACAELWHHARGLCAWLSVPHSDACFAPIRGHHRRLAAALLGVRPPELPSGAPPRSAPPTAAATELFLTQRDEVRSLARGVCELLNQFRSEVPEDAPPPAGAADRFVVAAESPDQLADWLEATRDLCLTGLPRLLYLPDEDGVDPVEAIRIAADRVRGRREFVYTAEVDWVGNGGVTGLKTARECLDAQRRLLFRLRHRFWEGDQERSRLGLEKWREERLRPALCLMPPAARLARAVEAFAAVHARLVTPRDGPIMWFTRETGRRLSECRAALAQPIEADTSPRRWEGLFGWARQVVGVTSDHLDAPPAPKGKELSDRQLVARLLSRLKPHHRAMEVIYALRNRHAHNADKKSYTDWLEAQQEVAKRLGRRFDRYVLPDGLDLFAPGHLRLTNTEVCETQTMLLEELTVGLEQLTSAGGNA